MQTDALARLKDIHLPVEPGFWPPAPGWWLAALLVLAALVGAAVFLGRRRTRRRPYRRAQVLNGHLRTQLDDGALTPVEYADAVNRLLKRVTVHVRGDEHATRLSGAAWLTYLDELSPQSRFRERAVVLGSVRFERDPALDASSVSPAVASLLRQLEQRA